MKELTKQVQRVLLHSGEVTQRDYDEGFIDDDDVIGSVLVNKEVFEDMRKAYFEYHKKHELN